MNEHHRFGCRRSEREHELLRALAEAVRLFTLTQVARTWWTDTRWGRHRAGRATEQLASRGLVHVRRVLARPLAILEAPIAVWKPGMATPPFEQLVRQLHDRARVPAQLVTVIFASQRTVVMFASGKRPTIKLTQITHDLHVSELYLHYRSLGRSHEWLSEDRLPPSWPLRERPDAVLRDDQGRITRALEYGGDYPVARIEELHRGLARIGLAYELW